MNKQFHNLLSFVQQHFGNPLTWLSQQRYVNSVFKLFSPVSLLFLIIVFHSFNVFVLSSIFALSFALRISPICSFPYLDNLYGHLKSFWSSQFLILLFFKIPKIQLLKFDVVDWYFKLLFSKNLFIKNILFKNANGLFW